MLPGLGPSPTQCDRVALNKGGKVDTQNQATVRARAIDQRSEGAVASTRHTVAFLLASITLAVLGLVRNPFYLWPTALARPHARLLLYLQILALQLLWVGYVWFGMRRSAISMGMLIDGSKGTRLRWLRYLAIGVAGWIVYLSIGALLSAALHPSVEALRGMQAMLPKTPGERFLWAAFALTAGICEEIVYRGYLLRQFRGVTGSTFAALILQALGYSVVHLSLPIQYLAAVAVLGLLLGMLAIWQKSLVPGMVLHVAVGLAALVQPGAQQ